MILHLLTEHASRRRERWGALSSNCFTSIEFPRTVFSAVLLHTGPLRKKKKKNRLPRHGRCIFIAYEMRCVRRWKITAQKRKSYFSWKIYSSHYQLIAFVSPKIIKKIFLPQKCPRMFHDASNKKRIISRKKPSAFYFNTSLHLF